MLYANVVDDGREYSAQARTTVTNDYFGPEKSWHYTEQRPWDRGKSEMRYELCTYKILTRHCLRNKRCE